MAIRVHLFETIRSWLQSLTTIDPSYSTGFSLAAILLSSTLLGWPAAHRVVVRTMPRATPARGRRPSPPAVAWPLTSTHPLPPFVFVPPTIAPTPLLVLLVVTGEALILSGLLQGSLLLVALTPLGVLGVRTVALRTARWWYVRRLRAQLLPALQRLIAATGSYTTLLDGLHTITPTLAHPLRGEWQWVLEHLQQPYMVQRPDGRREQRLSTVAIMLQRLADQTPVALHARVLDHMAAIYHDGLEQQAHTVLTRIADALARQATLQRAITTQLGRIRGEAYVIIGAFGGIALWLSWTQAERVATAFFGSPWGLLMLGWFGFWLLLPLVVATVATRTPDLPL